MQYMQGMPNLENMHNMQIMQNLEDKKKYENKHNVQNMQFKPTKAYRIKQANMDLCQLIPSIYRQWIFNVRSDSVMLKRL